MSNMLNPANATDLPNTPHPVTSWENKEVFGHALCADSLYQSHIETTKKLRARQADYVASLPTDPREGISEALNALEDVSNSIDGHLEWVCNMLVAIEQMARTGDFDEFDVPKSIAFLAMDAVIRTRKSINGLEHVNEILRSSR